jgi:cytochrome P450
VANSTVLQGNSSKCPRSIQHSDDTSNADLQRKITTQKSARNWSLESILMRIQDFIHNAHIALYETLDRLWILPFLTGPIYPFLVPHLRSRRLFGFPKVDELTARRLEKLANSKDGLATFWMGPYPAFYVTSNEMRSALVRESHVGHVDDASVNQTRKWMNNNHVMLAFPVFQNIHSSTYQIQRKFLINKYTVQAASSLPRISEVAENYLEEIRGNILNLKRFSLGLVMRTSSELLGLHDWPLDKLLEHPEKTSAIERVAHYLITENGDAEYEEKLYEIFCEIFSRNFESLSKYSNDANLLRNIFKSRGVDFPETLGSFHALDKVTKHAIAMNFIATAIGGMVHSTSNSLDWAIARLLVNTEMKEKFILLLRSNPHLPIHSADLYDQTEVFGPICEWILENVFINPTFSHELYSVRKSQQVTLPNGKKLQFPSKSIIIVNYKSCNLNEQELNKDFKNCLSKTATTSRFIHDPKNASFGGSRMTQSSPKSRICPGAKTSLLEQMVLLSCLLRNFELSTEVPMDTSVDPRGFPLRERVSTGFLFLK